MKRFFILLYMCLALPVIAQTVPTRITPNTDPTLTPDRIGFAPTAVVRINRAKTDPATWITQPGTANITTVTGPDSTTGAANLSTTNNLTAFRRITAEARTFAVGDWILVGVYVKAGFLTTPNTPPPLAATLADFAVAKLTVFDASQGFQLDNGSNARLLKATATADTKWVWLTLASKVTKVVGNGAAELRFELQCDLQHAVNFYAPVLELVPAGTMTDVDAFDLQRNLYPHPNGAPQGSIALMDKQKVFIPQLADGANTLMPVIQPTGLVSTQMLPSGGGTFVVREADGAPAVSTLYLEFNQAHGFNVTDLGSNVARVGLSGVPYSVLNLSGGIVDADINASANIAWPKINKTGSSLADLATRSAADLNSGTLNDARLSNVITAGSCTSCNLTYDSHGRLTVASNGSAGMAIGNSITSATAGSVLFAGTGGVLSQNNSNFFWDNSNIRLGIGTSSPSQAVTVAGTVFGQALNISSSLSTSTYIALTHNGTFGGVQTFGSTPLRFQNAGGGQIYFDTTTNATSPFNLVNSSGTALLVVSDGSTYRSIQSQAVPLVLNGSANNVGIGLTNPGQKLSVAGTIESTTGGVKFPDGRTGNALQGNSNTIATSTGTFTTDNLLAIDANKNIYDSLLPSGQIPLLNFSNTFTHGSGQVIDLPVNSTTAFSLGLEFRHNNTGGAGAAGLGTYFNFTGEDDTNTNVEMARFGCKWTTAAHTTRVSACSIWTANGNVAVAERFTFGGVGDFTAAGLLFAGSSVTQITDNTGKVRTGALDLTLSGWLDTIGSTRGSILYRGASGWAALPPDSHSGYVLTNSGTGTDPSWAAAPGGGGGGGSVTSVALSMPSIFSVSGSPVTTSGTLTATLNNQNANAFLAGPNSGGAGAVTFRAINSNDLGSQVVLPGAILNLESWTAGDFHLPDSMVFYDSISATANRKASMARVMGFINPATAQHRLTTESGVPVSTSDRTAQSTIYLTPYAGNHVSLYDGTRWLRYQLPEIGLPLSGLTSGKNYDVFAFRNDMAISSINVGTQVITFNTTHGIQTGSWVRCTLSNGDFTYNTIYYYRALSATTGRMYPTLADALADTNAILMTGSSSTFEAVSLELLVWTNDTTRATALSTQDSVTVKSGAATRRYMGTIRTTGTTTTEDSNAKRFVWNKYNRVLRTMIVVESGFWSIQQTTWRQANNNSADQLEWLTGEAGDAAVVKVFCTGQNANSDNTAVGIGINSTTVNSSHMNARGGAGPQPTPILAELYDKPVAGYTKYVWIERTETAAVGLTMYGAFGQTLKSGISLVGSN